MGTPNLPTTGQLNWGTPLNNYIENELDPAGSATTAITNHKSASDPHGDRSYANTLVSGFTTGANLPNGFVQLDVTGHIPATLAPTGGGITSLYDVKANFGATGNGTTDDSTAINNALTGCAAAGGGWVWVPAGTFACASTLVIGNNTALVLVPGAVIKRIGNPNAPGVMLANYTSSSTTGASNILVMGGMWVADGVSTNCTPMTFVNGGGIVVKDTSIRGVQGGSGNPAIVTAGCQNVLYDNIALPGTAPSGARSAYYPPAFQIETTASATVSGLNSAMYSGSPPCKNIGIRNCDITAATSSDGNGNYTFYKFLAGSINPVSSVYQQNIIVTANTATGLCSTPVWANNWQYTNIADNTVQSFITPFTVSSWTPSTPPALYSQMEHGNYAADTYAFAFPFDSWHNFNPLNTGYDVIGSGFFAKYRLTPNNELQLSANIHVTNGPSTSFIQLNANALPPAYRPVSTHIFPIGTNELAVLASPNNTGALGEIATSGFIYVYGASSGATGIMIEAIIPLDV